MTDRTPLRSMDLEGFKTCLQSKDAGVRFRALQAALKVGDRRCVEVVLSRAHREPVEEIRVAMVKVAAILGTPVQFQSLLPLVEDPLPGVRMIMAMALVRMRHAPFFPLLVRLMGDQDIAVREFCGQVLIKLGKKRLVQLLESMAASPVDWMRLAAVSACRQFRSRRLLGVLERALEDRNAEVKAQARRGLGRLADGGNERAAALLGRAASVSPEKAGAPPRDVLRPSSDESRREQSRVILMPEDELEASQTSIDWGDFVRDASSIELPADPGDLASDTASAFSLESGTIKGGDTGRKR